MGKLWCSTSLSLRRVSRPRDTDERHYQLPGRIESFNFFFVFMFFVSYEFTHLPCERRCPIRWTFCFLMPRWRLRIRSLASIVCDHSWRDFAKLAEHLTERCIRLSTENVCNPSAPHGIYWNLEHIGMFPGTWLSISSHFSIVCVCVWHKFGSSVAIFINK